MHILVLLIFFLLRSLIAWLFNEGTYCDTDVPEAPKRNKVLSSLHSTGDFFGFLSFSLRWSVFREGSFLADQISKVVLVLQ